MASSFSLSFVGLLFFHRCY